MNKIIKTILLILIALAGVSLPVFASYLPFNTNVNMNVGIGTTTPQGAFVVTNGNVGIGTWAPAGALSVMNGNIGIGVNAPGAALDASGNIRVSNIIFASTIENYSENAYLLQRSGTNTLVGNSASGLMIIQDNGNVGIGSTAPGQTIDVTGTVRTIGFTMSGQTPVSGYVLTASDSSGDATWSPSSSLGSNYWLNDIAGNVGISTTYAVGIGTSFVGGPSEAALSVMNGNVGIGTWVPQALLDVGNATLGDVVADTAGNLGAAGYITSGYDLIVGSQDDAGGVWFGVSLSGVGMFGNFTTNLLNLWTSNVNRLNIDAAGNIGIGTLNGISKLNINGGVGIGTSLTSGAYLNLNSAPSGGLIVQNNVGIGTFYPFGGKLIVNGGNVGIGSLAPGQALDVNGTVRMTGLTLTGNGAGNGNVLVGNAVGVGTWMPASTLLAGGGTNYWLLNGGGNVGINTTQAVGIGTTFVGGPSEAALSIMNGNVGIGTWVPGYELETEGGNVGLGVNSNTSFLQIGQVANSQSVPNGLSLKDYITSTASNQSEAEVEAIARVASNTGNTYFGIVGDVNNNLASAVNYTATVGLAGVAGYTTSSGSGIITGVASIYAGNSSYTGSGGGITNAYGVLVSDQTAATNNYGVYSGITSGANKWNFYGNGTAPNYFDGNVGIGSITPGQALDVNGTVRMTGLTLTGNGAGNGNVLVGNSIGVGTWMPASTLLAGGGTNYWLLNGGGNVGINTTQAVGIGTSFVGGTGEAALSVMNGNVGIGTWIPAYPFDLRGAPGGTWGFIGAPNSDGAGIIFKEVDGLPGEAGEIDLLGGSSARLSFVAESGAGGNSIGGVGTLSLTGNSGFNTAGVDVVLGDGEASEGYTSGTGATADINDNFNPTSGTGIYIALGITPTINQTGGANGITRGILVNPTLTSAYDFRALETSVGNVGIGTISGNLGIGSQWPGQRLDVNGTARMGGFILAGNGAGNGNVLVGNSIGVGTWMPASTLLAGGGTNYWLLNGGGNVGINTTQAVGIGTTFVGGKGEAALSIMNGNVGIGTWVPAQQIDAPNGVVRADSFDSIGSNGLYFQDSTSNGNIRLYASNGAQDLGLTLQTNLNANGGVDIDGNGNVGIGTLVPSQLFEIGAQKVDVTSSGNVGIGSINPGQKLDVQGTIRTTGFTLSGNGAANGNVLVGNAVGVGTWMPASTLLAGGGTNYWLLNGGGNVGINTTQAVGIGTSFVGGPSEAALSVMNGNVGIGTWVPGYTLEVAGAAGGSIAILSPQFTASTLTFGYPGQFRGRVQYSNDATDTLSLISSGIINFSVNDAGSEAMTLDSHGNLGIGTITPAGGLAVMNGNVGIGTWVPSQAELTIVHGGGGQNPLSIYAIGNSGSPDFSINNTGALLYSPNSGFVGTAVNFGNNTSSVNSGSTFFLVNPGSSAVGNTIFQVKNGSVNQFIINADNNVGISSLTPGQKLDVQGTVRTIGFTMSGQTPVSGYVLTASDSSGDATWSPSSSVGTNYWLNDIAGNVGISTTYAVGIGTTFVGGPSEAALSVMNGKVGIGTWLPIVPLQIVGIGTQNISGGGLIVTNGNVGIGTTVPGYSLDVQAGNSSLNDQWIIHASSNDSNPAGAYIAVDNTSATDHQAGFTIANQGAGKWYIINSTLSNNTDDFGIYSAALSESIFDITPSGNIGIGTLTSQGGLTVMNGNVGIGTWIPGNLLQINGPMPTSTTNLFSVTNSLAPSGYLAIGNSTNGANEYQPQITGQSAGYNGNALIFLGLLPAAQDVLNGNDGAMDFQVARSDGSAIQNTPLFSFMNNAGASVMMIDKSGNVGIGTNAPFGGKLIIPSGNVGIGSLAPGQVLDVNGTVRMAGFTLSGNGAAAGNVLVSNTIGVGTWMPTTTLPVGTLTSGTINQVAYYSGALTLSSNSAMVFNAPNVGLGTVTPLATLQVVGNIGIGTVKNGDNFITTAPPNGGFIAEGNVGVGSWAPGQKLDVQGTVRDIGELVNGNVGIGTTFVNGTGEGALTVMNGNVGIGTWVPDHILNVVGPPGSLIDVNPIRVSANASGSAGVGIEINNTNASGTDMETFINYLSQGTLKFQVGVDDFSDGIANYYIQDTTAGTTRFFIDPSGNIGIGTTTPQGGVAIMNGNVGIGSLAPGQKLDIQGTLRDLGEFVNGNVGIGTTFVNGAGEGAVSVMNGNVGIGTWIPAGQLDVEGTLSVVYFKGNVGIGTATVPQYNLDLVNGTSRQRYVRRVNTTTGGATPIAINSDTTDLFTITALAQNSVINITAGTPNNGDLLEIRILDNGTARTLTWGSAGATIASTTTILPATTVISTTLRVLLEYNSASTRWECVGVT